MTECRATDSVARAFDAGVRDVSPAAAPADAAAGNGLGRVSPGSG